MPVQTASKVSWKGGDSAAPDAIDFLSHASSYHEYPTGIERQETHTSWVFLTPHHVYKLKKQVRHGFVDFSTPLLRKQACEAEVRLNRRLAPEVYLGVLPIMRTRWGMLHLGGGGIPVDWVVKMRRLPADRSLDTLIRSSRLAPVQIEGLAQCLAEFYDRLPPLMIRASDYRARIEEHVHGNRDELLAERYGLDPLLVEHVHAALLRVLRLAPELLEDRVCDGRVVEGHGDLRPEHVYFVPTPMAIDCIEFSEELRDLDVLDDLSFLAMECDCLGAGEVGGRILERYVQVSGDRPPHCLVPFYKCYRATVRAKVAVLRSRQHGGAERRYDLQIADRYLRLANGYTSQLGSRACRR
jgi:aminoglycoside phosphotransferase family enzyme